MLSLCVLLLLAEGPAAAAPPPWGRTGWAAGQFLPGGQQGLEQELDGTGRELREMLWS